MPDWELTVWGIKICGWSPFWVEWGTQEMLMKLVWPLPQGWPHSGAETSAYL